MFAIATTSANRLRDDFDESYLLARDAQAAAPRQLDLAVEFRSRDGRSWNAIGGETSAAAAIQWARECCPSGTTWYAVSWNDLYGEMP